MRKLLKVVESAVDIALEASAGAAAAVIAADGVGGEPAVRFRCGGGVAAAAAAAADANAVAGVPAGEWLRSSSAAAAIPPNPENHICWTSLLILLRFCFILLDIIFLHVKHI